MAKVVLENVYKNFPNRTRASSAGALGHLCVLQSIDLVVNDGEFMVLVGPSGCGKSTLLRLIAGLEEPSSGNIYSDDRLVNHLPPKERDIAMVFQNYALYPHLNVYDNIAFGLRRMNSLKKDRDGIENLLGRMTRNFPKKWRYLGDREKIIEQKVREVARLLQIEALLDRFPKQLSGGQKQRVALGRAIARDPRVFLMDEPLSNLDAKLRAETRTQIVKLQKQLGTTTIYVTHDQTEAMTMGDRIAVMDRGRILQIAPPLEIYQKPANRFVAEFIGSPPMNFLPVKVEAPLTLVHRRFNFELPRVWARWLAPYDGIMLSLGIRSEHLTIAAPTPENLPVRVDLVEALGNDTYVSGCLVDEPDSSLQVRLSGDRLVKAGETIWLSIALDRIHLFDSQTGRAIWQE